MTNEITDSEIKYGVVDNCLQLYVRRKPNINSKIVTVLNKSDTVKIKDSGRDFYSVITANGVFGFCMKKYISIQG